MVVLIYLIIQINKTNNPGVCAGLNQSQVHGPTVTLGARINWAWAWRGAAAVGLVSLACASMAWAFPVNGQTLPAHLLVAAFAAIGAFQILVEGRHTALDGWQESRTAAAAPGAGISLVSRQNCLEFAAAHPVCSLATLDARSLQPRVRTACVWRADSEGLYFVFPAAKETNLQIKAHPEVEICFLAPSSNHLQTRQMRVRGQLRKVVGGQLLLARTGTDLTRQTLPAGGHDGDLHVFLLADFTAHIWSMAAVAAVASKVAQAARTA